jgi:hypothetical protein
MRIATILALMITTGILTMAHAEEAIEQVILSNGKTYQVKTDLTWFAL